MKSSPSAPPAPDPTQTANAQSTSNINTAIANAELNRVSQQTPWGSINYSVTGKNPDGTPIYTSQIQLSPAQQQLLDQQQGLSSSRNSMAQQILGQQGNRITNPLDFSSLAPIVNHGQVYQGAVNSPANQAANKPIQFAAPAQPQGQPQGQQQITPAMIQQLLAALGQQGGGQSQPGQPTQPQPSQQPQASQFSGPSTSQSMAALVGNQNPFGTSGVDIMNTIAQNPNDPRLASMFTQQQQGSEGTQTVLYPNQGSRLDPSGAITNPNNPKDPFVQVGNLPDGRVTDMSKVIYDPQFGAITTQSNINQKQLQNDAFSTYFPMLAIGGGIMGPALAGAAAGLGASGAGGAAPSGAVPSYAGEIGQAVGGDTAPMGAFDQFGSSGLGGTNPLPSSFTSQLQALGQKGIDNLASGRGLFGMNRSVNTGLSALIQALRNKQQPGG